MNFESDDFHSNYEVGNKLGHGHFAEVKHCINKINKIEYAAKFIRLRQLMDEKHQGMIIEDIEREANILMRLDHQNVIKLFFCYDLGKNIVLLLELVSGGELFDHISDSEKLSEEEASEFIEQIVFGLQHMHDRNIVHLDLKPENVMIENLKERKIKLIDFGLAREIKNKNTVIEMQGTAEFLAPEVIEYNPISYATDMWAIGVITYIMLTGVSPFSGDDQISTFQNIVNCRLEFDEEICSDMSEMAKNFINSLLILDARKRAKASDCLIHPWIKPMEPSIMFRRRSSIISKEKLLSLKHFVVCPSPPTSEETTPDITRKHSNNTVFLENVKESSSDDSGNECLAEEDHSFKTKTVDSLALSSSPNNYNVNNEYIKKENEFSFQEYQNKLEKKLLLESNEIDNYHKLSDFDSKQSYINDNFPKDQNLSFNEESCYSSRNSNCNNIQIEANLNTDKANKQTFNNSISNSVRRFSTKIESITSFFDSKNKINSSSKASNRGSLKNLFTVNGDSLFSNLPKSTNFTNTQRSSNCVKDSVFYSKPVSASVATSPTVLKKSMFFNRYLSALESKKK